MKKRLSIEAAPFSLCLFFISFLWSYSLWRGVRFENVSLRASYIEIAFVLFLVGVATWLLLLPKVHFDDKRLFLTPLKGEEDTVSFTEIKQIKQRSFISSLGLVKFWVVKYSEGSREKSIRVFLKFLNCPDRDISKKILLVNQMVQFKKNWMSDPVDLYKYFK